jgi:hypothetical protein
MASCTASVEWHLHISVFATSAPRNLLKFASKSFFSVIEQKAFPNGTLQEGLEHELSRVALNGVARGLAN